MGIVGSQEQRDHRKHVLASIQNQEKESFFLYYRGRLNLALSVKKNCSGGFPSPKLMKTMIKLNDKIP